MTQPRLHLDSAATLSAVRAALQEDLGARGDVTTLALVPEDVTARAVIQSREDCVVSGGPVAIDVFHAVESSLRCSTLIPDGRPAGPGDTIMEIEGPARGILTAERTALNYMQRLTGIATLTAEFVRRVEPLKTMILDTRKTTPGLRLLEKYAVLCGGGQNHRIGLYDRVLVKDNHRALWGRATGRALALDEAILVARQKFPGIPVEVEVENMDELRSALRAKPEWLLLDNMTCDQMREAVALCVGKTRTEASGGITIDRVRDVAETGVDAISLGCLTHSAPAIDLTLEILP
jgi:nicotinate-nucleotide pyrophosphorylase (carboxylating)